MTPRLVAYDERMHMDVARNALLGALPGAEIERLEPYLKKVPLTPGQRLLNSGEPLSQLYFPLEGAVSRLVHLITGETVEAGIVGSDGVVGLPVALGGTHSYGIAEVQAAGSAVCLSAADYAEHVRASQSPLFEALVLYTNFYIAMLTQLTACHCVHRIERRLSRLILTLDDRTANGAVRVTHDTLAEFLGVHRPSVTYALQALAETGALRSERRRIAILDRPALERHACECYTGIREATGAAIQQIKKHLRV